MVKISFFYISYLNLQDNINVSTMGTFVIFYQTIYTFQLKYVFFSNISYVHKSFLFFSFFSFL